MLAVGTTYVARNGQRVKINCFTEHTQQYHGEVIRGVGFKPYVGAWLANGKFAFSPGEHELDIHVETGINLHDNTSNFRVY